MAKYRIVPHEVTWGDGSVHFEYTVQKKVWFFWTSYILESSTLWPFQFGHRFPTEKAAEVALKERVIYDLGTKPQIREIEISYIDLDGKKS